MKLIIAILYFIRYVKPSTGSNISCKKTISKNCSNLTLTTVISSHSTSYC